jgi:hypothetical protein
MRWRRPAPRACGASTRADRRLALLALLALGLAGCGYTRLRAPGPPAAVADTSRTTGSTPEPDVDPAALPPDHPRILSDAEWEGRSLLDDIVGEDDPLRFENLRRMPQARDALPHADVTFRMQLGGPVVTRIWEIRMDRFGWVTAAHWTQGDVGPRLDASLAARRAEFRPSRESESALREILVQLLPPRERASVRRPERVGGMPFELWPYDDSGVIRIDYRTEVPTAVSVDEWPGGSVEAPLDLVELLIRTWDGPPPPELRRLAHGLARRLPALVDAALLVEALVLTWEIEGFEQRESLELPLGVGR